MSNTRKEFETEMKRILKTVEQTGDLPNEYDMHALKECCDQSLLTGVVTATMVSGRIIAEIGTPRVTKDGMDFLHPPRDKKFIVSTAVAVVSVSINLLLLLLNAYQTHIALLQIRP